MIQNFEDYRRIISLDSSPFVGVVDLCAAYAELCEKLGLKYEFVNDGLAILVFGNSKSASDLFIYNDLETDEPGPHSLWDESNQNPFEATISRERLIGLGVAGSKLSMLNQMFALKKWKDQGGEPSVCLLGGAFSNLKEDLASPFVSKAIESCKNILVSRPTSSRVLTGICGYAKVKFNIPLGKQESDLKKKHLEDEDTSTQTRIFRGRTTHGASLNKKADEDAFVKLVDYLRMLPEGVLVLTMEAGHSVNAVASEAILELNLSQPVAGSSSSKLIALVDELSKLSQSFNEQRSNGDSQLPNLNIGKLRHNPEHLELGVGFYLPHDFNKEKLLLSLNQVQKNLEATGIEFRVADFQEGAEFEKDDAFLSNIKQLLNQKNIEWNEGDSVMKSASRRLSSFRKPMLQFGLANGLGNVNEPNESVEVKDIEDSIDLFFSIMERYK